MKYKEISVFTTEAGLDAVCARFSMLGMENGKDKRNFGAVFVPVSGMEWKTNVAFGQTGWKHSCFQI